MRPSANKTNRESGETAVKVLLYDVESFPNKGYTWGKWEQNVIEFEERRMICSIAFQWYPSREVHVIALPDFQGYDPKKKTNRSLMRAFSRELAKADIAIGHNIVNFDDPMVNTDLLKHRIAPPPPHRTVDTLRVLRTRFRFNSNRLDDVCQELGIGKKVKHPGFKMWVECMEGNPSAWVNMKKYNKGDVGRLLRPLYERVRPWMTNHPSMTALDGFDGCPKCRKSKMRPKGWRIAGGWHYQRFICRDKKCRGWARGSYVKNRWRFQ